MKTSKEKNKEASENKLSTSKTGEKTSADVVHRQNNEVQLNRENISQNFEAPELKRKA